MQVLVRYSSSLPGAQQVLQQVLLHVRRLQVDKSIPHPGDVSADPEFLLHKMEYGISPMFSRQDALTVSGGRRHDEHSEKSKQRGEVH